MRNISKYNYIDLIRCVETSQSIIGRLFVNDEYYCFTLEPKGLEIPTGEYDLSLDIVSPKFRFRSPYNTLCKGKVPRVLNVPNRDGILIHIGTYPKDSSGCILVADKWFRTQPNRLFYSTSAFIRLYKTIQTFKYPIKLCVSTLEK